MTAIILGIGTSAPPHSITQDAAAALACRLRPLAEDHARLIPALYRRAGVRSRASVLLPHDENHAFFEPASSPTDRGPGTAARSDRYSVEAPTLAAAASIAALADAKLHARDMTHLITVSCTGFAAPGVDVSLIRTLGLSPTVERTHIGFMGCHASINALRVAKAFCDADPAARVLICAVELCSLHFHYTHDPEKLVANALFADGAAAAVISGQTQQASELNTDASHHHAHHEALRIVALDLPRVSDSTATPIPAPLPILASASCLVPDSLDAMTWRIGDHGYEMTLSPRVPALIESYLRPWLVAWLDSLNLKLADIASWAVHPGGPRVLTAVADSLCLPAAAMDASRAILANHGNMSSPTVLFILNHLRHQTSASPAPITPCLLLAFGPGLVIEAALLGTPR